MKNLKPDLTVVPLKSQYKVTKDENGKYVVTVIPAFIDSVQAGIAGLVNIEPIAANLYRMFTQVCGKDADPRIPAATFYRQFDQSIPIAMGSPNSPERHAYDSHPGLNRLRRLCTSLGKKIVTGAGKKKDKKAQMTARKKNVSAFGTWAKKFHVSAQGIAALFAILGRKKDFVTDVMVDAGFKRASESVTKVTRKTRAA